MPASKIKISSKSKLEIDDASLNEILSLLKINQNRNFENIGVRTFTDVDVPFTSLSEFQILFNKKNFSDDFGNLLIDSDTTLTTSVGNINSMLEDFFKHNKVDYVKRIELISATEKELSFKILSKIGLAIPLVIELPIIIDRFLILNFKIMNGAKIFLKLINSILKLSSNKSIIDNNNTVRLDIRELTKLPQPLLYIVDNWMSKLNGEVVFKDNKLKLNLSFKIDKTPFDKIQL